MTYAYEEAGRFLGEVSLVTEIDDPDYVVPRVRAYFSHLLVKEECRGRGSGESAGRFYLRQGEGAWLSGNQPRRGQG